MRKLCCYVVLLLSFFACNDTAKKEEDMAVVASDQNNIEDLEIMDFQTFEPLLHRSDDKIRVVNFWATWCAPCVKELPYFEKLNQVYGQDNVEVILVSLDFPKQYDSKLKPFIEDRELRSRVIALNDVDFNAWLEKVDSEWSGAIPATLIYSKNKRQFYEASFDWEELENELKTFL